MPNKHFYFAMGALHGTAVVFWVHSQRHAWFERYHWMRRLYRWNPDWFLYFPVVIALFGCLALVPDTLYALGILPKSVIRSDAFNLFYGYTWFEHIEDTSQRIDHLVNTIGSALLYVMSLMVLIYYTRLVNANLHQHCALQKTGLKCHG